MREILCLTIYKSNSGLGVISTFFFDLIKYLAILKADSSIRYGSYRQRCTFVFPSLIKIQL